MLTLKWFYTHWNNYSVTCLGSTTQYWLSSAILVSNVAATIGPYLYLDKGDGWFKWCADADGQSHYVSLRSCVLSSSIGDEDDSNVKTWMAYASLASPTTLRSAPWIHSTNHLQTHKINKSTIYYINFEMWCIEQISIITNVTT